MRRRPADFRRPVRRRFSHWIWALFGLFTIVGLLLFVVHHNHSEDRIEQSVLVIPSSLHLLLRFELLDFNWIDVFILVFGWIIAHSAAAVTSLNSIVLILIWGFWAQHYLNYVAVHACLHCCSLDAYIVFSCTIRNDDLGLYSGHFCSIHLWISNL